MERTSTGVVYMKLVNESKVRQFNSPLVVDQSLFMKLSQKQEEKLSPEEKSLLSTTMNRVLFEITSYPDDGFTNFRINKENKRAQGTFHDGNIWKNIYNKLEVRDQPISIKVRFYDSEIEFALFHKSPINKKAFSKVTMSDILNRRSKMKLRRGDLTASIEFLKDLNIKWELDLLERKHTKVKCNDEHLESIRRILDSDSIERPILQATPELDCAFLVSTDRKPLESVNDQDCSTKDTPQKAPVVKKGSQFLANSERNYPLNKLQQESSEEGDWIGDKVHRPLNFRDSTPGDEHLSDEDNKQAIEKETHKISSVLFGDKSYRLNSSNKRENGERLASIRKNSQMKMTPNKDDSNQCCICTFGKLDCEHTFCFDCIMGWSNTTNSCPLCKREFLRIIKQTSKGLLIDEIIIQPKRIDLEQLLQDQEPNLENAEDHCYACNGTECEEDMLVCDHCLRKCCHTYCLVPAIDEIPHEPWYCDYCRRDHNIRSILPCANLFQSEPSERSNRVMRVPPSNPTTSRGTSIQSRGASLPRSNRSNSNASFIQGGPLRGRNRNRNDNQRNPRNRLRNNSRRQRRQDSSSSESEQEQGERFVNNPDFEHQDVARNRPASRRMGNTRLHAAQVRAPNQAIPSSINSNPNAVRLLQFSSRASSFNLANTIATGNFDPTSFDDEFRENTRNTNLIPSTRDRAVVTRPVREENLF